MGNKSNNTCSNNVIVNQMCLRWIMGYIPRQVTLQAFTPSDTVLISNDVEDGVNSVPYVKSKEMKIIGRIYSESRFRFTFDIKTGLATHLVYGKIYKNGIPIGTEQSDGTGVYATKTEDINIGNWMVGDTIELWVKYNAFPASVYVKNFRLCGATSPLINTKFGA